MAELPEYKRTTEIKASGDVPDFQGAMEGLASASWGSFGALAASAAQSASQQMAKQTGYQLGLNPQGDLSPPITDFDKTVADSYHAQAYSTLTLQANQMFYNADNSLKQAPYLTDDLLNSTQRQLTMGVQGIVNNAPIAIKGQLETNLINQVQANTSTYRNKMQEQNFKIDVSTANQFVKEQLISINNLTMAGDISGAREAADTAIDVIKEHRKMGLIKTPEEEKEQINAVEDARDQSIVNFRYAENRNRGKGAEYIANLANSKDIPETKKTKLIAGVLNYKNQIDNARNEYENIAVAKMGNQIAMNPTQAQSDMLAFKNEVSPLRYQQVEHELIQAMKARDVENAGVTELMANWRDPEAHAAASQQVQSKTYENLVNGLVQNSQAEGNPISREDAEVMAVTSAGAPVHEFTKALNYKAISGSPAMIESANRQYQNLIALKAGKALTGVSDEARAIMDQYTALSHQMPPDEAARQAYDNVKNQTPDTIKAVSEQWSMLVNSQVGVGYGKHASQVDFALNSVGIKPKEIPNAYLRATYGTDILNMLKSNYQLTKGDWDSAKRLTQQQVDLTYGYSKVNGNKAYMQHPLETVLGYKTSDVVPYIHEDMKRQLDKRFEPLKQAFNDGKSNSFYTTEQVDKTPSSIRGNYQPLRITKHTKGKKPETFDAVIIGNNIGSWDVSINTNYGIRSLFLEAPELGLVTYMPDKKYIDANYQQKNHIGAMLPKTEGALGKYFLPQAENK